MKTDYEALRTENHKGADKEAYVRIRRCDHDFQERPGPNGLRYCLKRCGAALRDPDPA